MGFLGGASLDCALLEVCHRASVAVNLVSLPEASEVKKGSSFFLLLILCDEREKGCFKDLSLHSPPMHNSSADT